MTKSLVFSGMITYMEVMNTFSHFGKVIFGSTTSSHPKWWRASNTVPRTWSAKVVCARSMGPTSRQPRVTLLAKITSYSNFLFGVPGFELNKLPIRSLPLVELIRTQEVLPRRFLVHVCGISAGSRDAFCFIFVASPLAHATLSGSSLWHLR